MPLSLKEAPEVLVGEKAPRIAIYEPWGGNIDEGWTRWVLEQFRFPFTALHNADIQDGHLRDHYDSIVIPEMNARQIMDGMTAGSVPGQYAGGIGDNGRDALREFVGKGGTLVVFGNAAQFAIDQFSLPVTNVVANLRQEQFSAPGRCCGRNLKRPTTPWSPGCPQACR